MQEASQEREDQIPKCSACRYQAPDPVREVVHGTDGPNAVVATNLFQTMPPNRRKILAFADGRQEAAFFAWYLEKSYRDILNRNLLLKAAREMTAHSPDGCSLRDLASGLKNARSLLPFAQGSHPKYGFPVDVVELDTQTSQQSAEASEVHFQRDLSIAIAEFAPTSKLVANKLEWTASGLKKVAEKEWPCRFYKRCVQDNVFLHWEEGKPEPQTPCSHTLAVGLYLIPQFGFVADRAKPKPPKARPARVFTKRVATAACEVIAISSRIRIFAEAKPNISRL